jgi:hypothetical protein
MYGCDNFRVRLRLGVNTYLSLLCNQHNDKLKEENKNKRSSATLGSR